MIPLARIAAEEDGLMKYFLAKTEPGTYSIDDLEREKHTSWDGVRNPQAVRAIREMRPGDRVFLYHSGGASSVVGISVVKSAPCDDPKNPKSAIVDLEFAGRLEPPVTLAEIKQSGKFDEWALVRQGRLSTMAAPENFVAWMRERYPRAKI
jgi:predicted RNA-binding protein with PUA-like domain